MDDYNSKFTGPEIDDAIARALPDGAIDITLQNKAPAGYGLGTNAVTPPNNSLDDAVKNGWYICSPTFNGAPTGHSLIGYGTVFVIERASDCCIQVYWSEAASNIAGSPLNLVRKYNGTTWSPWEWVNPPMLLGVEYRTTDRHLGKPVYAKTISIGALPNATTKEADTGISIAYNIIDRAVYSINPGGYEIVDMNRFELEDKLVVGSASWSYLVVSTSDYSSYTTTYVTFKYTKD